MAINFTDEASRPAPERLAQARAVLAQVEERKEVRPLTHTNLEPLTKAPAEGAKRPGPSAAAPVKMFDRAAYQKAYMKEYMRGYRARRGKSA